MVTGYDDDDDTSSCDENTETEARWGKLVWFMASLLTIFQLYIVTVSFIGGGNWRKPTTCRKSLTNFIT